MITVDTITDEQIVEATSFDPRVRESNVELIQLRARALTGQGHGYDVTAEMRQAARARCAEILNARAKTLPPGFVLHRGWRTWYAVAGLAETLPLEQREIKIFSQTLRVPRLTAWMGEASYTYSGIEHAPAAMPSWLERLRVEITAKTGARFNSVLANYYRDGRDSVAWHADDEFELGPEPVIASLSLGASRRFAVRERATKVGTPSRWDIILEHGDLLVMRGRSQADYLHAVPCTTKQVGARLNLTFRWVNP